MKNLKWFLSLALALTFLAWSAPKVLAASELEIAVERLKNAISLLAPDSSLTQNNDNFGYYQPAWERGQVLGTQVTACNGVWKCLDGTYPTVTDNIMYCPSGEPTCQSSTSGGSYTPPGGTGVCQPPPTGCMPTYSWNQGNCSCEPSNNTNTTQPTNCGTPPVCSSGSSLKYPSSGGCGYCDYSVQTQPVMSCPAGQQPECPSGPPKMINNTPTCSIPGETWTCKSFTNQPNCQPVGYCNGQVVRENNCDVCKPNPKMEQKPQQPQETCNLDGKGEVEGPCWQWSKDRYGNWTRNQQDQNNRQQQKPMMPQRDYNFENEENFDYGRVCTARDAQADIRDAKRMLGEIKSLLKTKNLNPDLKAKLIGLQNRANTYIAAAVKPGEDFCDIMDDWRQGGETNLHPNEELNNIRIVATFPVQLSKFKKELAAVEKLISKRKINKETLAKFVDYLKDIKTAFAEAETQFAAGDYDGLWDNLDFQDGGGPGDVRCTLDLAPMFEKIDGIKKMDAPIKAAIDDIKDTFYSAIDDGQFREACQIGNDSRYVLEPFLRAKPATSKAASIKLQNLRAAIEKKYGGEYVEESNPQPSPSPTD